MLIMISTSMLSLLVLFAMLTAERHGLVLLLLLIIMIVIMPTFIPM